MYEYLVEEMLYSIGMATISITVAEFLFHKYELKYHCKALYPNDFTRPSILTGHNKIISFLVILILITACLFLNHDIQPNFLKGIFISLIIGISLSFAMFDAKYMIIPNISLILLSIISIGYLGLNVMATPLAWTSILMNAVEGIAFGALFPLCINKLVRHGMGQGDVKMFAAMGIITGGLGIAYTMLIAWLLQVIAFYICIEPEYIHKDSLPLAPFAIISYLVMFPFIIL